MEPSVALLAIKSAAAACLTSGDGEVGAGAAAASSQLSSQLGERWSDAFYTDRIGMVNACSM